MTSLPAEFVPSQDLSRLSVRSRRPSARTSRESARLWQKADEIIGSHPEVIGHFSSIGGFGGGVNSGNINVTLKPPKERKLSQTQLQATLRRELNAIPGVRAVDPRPLPAGVHRPARFSRLIFRPRVRIGTSSSTSATDIMDKLGASGTVVDLDTDYQIGMPELRVLPDRALPSDVGVSIDDVATTLNALVGGVRVGKYSTGGRRVDVRLKLLAAQRTRPETSPGCGSGAVPASSSPSPPL